jgi:hypothetical protein
MARPPRHALIATTLCVAALAGTASCAARYPRFLDQSPVTVVADDAPIPLPPVRVDPADVVAFSEAFVKRPLVDAMRPERVPRAGDVNSLDEVPRSSWFMGDRSAPPTSDGPPHPPLRVLSERTPTASTRGIAVVDTRGKRYELFRDDKDRAGLRTGAWLVASRLTRAVGYRVPEAHVTELAPSDFVVEPGPAPEGSIPHGGRPPDERFREIVGAELEAFLEAAPSTRDGKVRVSAVRWPPGIDAGRTPDAGQNADDANDTVAHEDRRTLRALRVLAAWLGQDRLLPHAIRDVYVGTPGRGFLQHHVVFFDGALGADAVVNERPEQRDELTLLLTLGFAPAPELPPTQRRFLAVGAFGPSVDPARVRPGLPFAPAERLTPADAYWIAKRIGMIPRAVIDEAVAGARYADVATSRWLARTLDERRRSLYEHGFALVTPLDVVGVRGSALHLRDRAAEVGLELARDARYLVSLHAEDGSEVSKARIVRPTGPSVVIDLEPRALATHDYLVLRVRALRQRGSSSPMQVHVTAKGPWGLRVLGVVR